MSETNVQDEMQEIIQDFLVETGEMLEGLDRQLVDLEKSPGDLGLLNAIFRSFHTIKGASGFLGFRQLVELTHQAENVLNKLRQGEMAVTPEIMDAILAAVDMTKRLLGHIRDHDGIEEDLSGILGRLVGVLQGATVPKGPSAPSPDPPPKLGEILVQEGKITPEQLSEALVEQSETLKIGEILVRQRTASERDILEALEKQKEQGGGEQTIRVDIKRLDNVLNLVGELVLGRNRLGNLLGRLEGRYGDDGEVAALSEVTAHINRITTDLQLAVMKTRMQPIRKVFSKFPRMVRDLARLKGKEIAIQLFGEETELDKSVIEEIGDPLVHLVRNAIDHGIEPPEERERQGKPRQGTLLLSAYHEGNHIVIEMEDDGKGIDPEALRRKAVEKHLLDEADVRKLDDREAIQLIFLPGFSTAKEVSDLSGRGVGMDVVKTNIARLNGTVSVDTRVGRGTKMIVRLPLTVAIIQALMVEVGRDLFAIPLSTVVETIRIRPEEIHTIEQQEVIRLRKSILPLVRLDREFWVAEQRASTRLYVVVIAAGEKKVGIVVDRLRGQEEVVIKSLGEYLSGTEGLAGATITGDGRVVLILDIGALLAERMGK